MLHFHLTHHTPPHVPLLPVPLKASHISALYSLHVFFVHFTVLGNAKLSNYCSVIDWDFGEPDTLSEHVFSQLHSVLKAN